MNRIDQLIATHCPNGVEVKTLGSLGKRNKGTQITAAKMKTLALASGSIRVFAGGQTIADVSEDAIPSKNVIRVPSIIVKSRGHIGFSYYDKPFTHKNELWSYSIDHPEVDQKFVFYYLLTQVPKLQEIARATSVKLPQLGVRDTDRLPIPVPPLPVQREIVKILDTFTELVEELVDELEARKHQYEFYSNDLLIVDETTPYVKLGDVATIVRGASPRPIRNFLTDNPDGVPWIKIGDVPTDGKYVTNTAQRITHAGAEKSRLIKPGDFILSNSMSFGRPYVSQIEGCIHDGWLAISGFEDTYMRDYLYYLLRSRSVQENFERRAGSGTVRNLNADIVRSTEIPAPSFELQQRVVDILDKFDALVNDISIGLPAEIEARHQQFEYYRDKLLSFKELETAS